MHEEVELLIFNVKIIGLKLPPIIYLVVGGNFCPFLELVYSCDGAGHGLDNNAKIITQNSRHF